MPEFQNFLKLSGNSSILTQAQTAQPSGYDAPAASENGMLTGKRTWVLDSSGDASTQSLLYVTYHDIYGREIRTVSDNHLGGTETVSTAYSVSGKPLLQRHVHTASGKSTLTEETENTYDNADRLLKTTHSVNGSMPVTLASYQYNQLGRIERKVTGELETTNYSYNIRGWTNRIQGTRFTEYLAYNTTSFNLTPSANQYNGNVSAVKWNNGSDQFLYRTYNYMYNKLGRLTNSTYSDNMNNSNDGNGRYGESFSYDLNGNVTGIVRYGRLDDNQYGKIDDLNLEYVGNQITRATDEIDGPFYAGAMHFVDGADEDTEYCYDANGNMTKDLNSNISLIEYNCLNLPSKIVFSNHKNRISKKKNMVR